MRQHIACLLIFLCFVGCAYKNPAGTPPTPPNVQIASFSKALADALHTANQSAMILRDNGKISQKEVLDVQEYIVLVANTGKQMDAVILSSDPWGTQREKIIKMWASSGLSIVKDRISTTAGVVLDVIVNVINQILAAVGGPTI
jgi:hypothetical protein